jgi:hypothetical protein
MPAFDSCRRTGAVSLGVRFPLPGNNGSAEAYGCDSSDAPYLRVVYSGSDKIDIKAVRAELASYPLVGQGSDTALLTLTNEGFRTSGAFWAYASLSGQPSESARVEPLGVGETVSVRIAVTPVDTAEEFVEYRLWAHEANDLVRHNDSAHLRCWVFPRGTYAAAGFDSQAFPPSGWVSVNADQGAVSWTTAAEEPRSGQGSAACAREYYVRNSDWLIGDAVRPTADFADSVGFFCRVKQSQPVETLRVWTLHSQDVRDTWELLGTFGLTDTSWQRYAIPLDSFDGGTAHIGFQNCSFGFWNRIFLDDIWFSRIFVPGTEEPATTPNLARTLSFEPNPTSGRFVTVRYGLGKRPTSKLTLRDVLGRTVRTVELDPSGSTRLDLRDIQPGVYVAALESVSPSVSRKLIITAPR